MSIRDFKIRVWYIDKQKMEYVNPYESFFRHITWNGHIFEDGVRQKCITMLSSNIVDINDKEIYDGDILLNYNHGDGVSIYEVIVRPGHHELRQNYIQWSGLTLVDLTKNCGNGKYQTYSSIVIGNVFENFDLLGLDIYDCRELWKKISTKR